MKIEKNSTTEEIFLDGDWAFTYTPQMHKELKIPEDEDFVVKMPVPGYWDDHLNRMKTSKFFYSTTKYNSNYRPVEFPIGEAIPPDSSLPYLEGVGWYKKTIKIPVEWDKREVILHIGGIIVEAWVWLNGELLKYHFGYSTPFEVSLSKHLKIGEVNEIVIAIANIRTDRFGCVTRGYKGLSAGIYRSVRLKVSGCARIKDCYIYPSDGLQSLNWSVELDGALDTTSLLQWFVKDPCDQTVVLKGEVPVNETSLIWKTTSDTMEAWSDKNPKLYMLSLTLVSKDGIIDNHIQSFGLRLLERHGESALLLNGHPVMLRGCTEHAYFPLTCTPPSQIEVYRDSIRKLKEIGFNWLRFHTWIPSEEYMIAADEMGMMIQVEPPVGFDTQEWLDILFYCRKHPSVVIYCCGNEELLDETRIEKLRGMAALSHKLVPDSLFNPQEAMRGIEYYFNITGVKDNNIDEPFTHNPTRLKMVREYSDVFGQYPYGLLSYNSITGDWRELNRRLEIYKRPCLSHEMGIHGNYINLDLENRYEGSRIGTMMYANIRKYLREEGMLSRAPLYYKNSCLWMKMVRKHNIEMARKCKYIAGYDFLGATDHHWHRYGYPCGIMNEFYELKFGENAEDVQKYNGESVILLDHTNNRNLLCGDTLALDLYASLYANEQLSEGKVEWYLMDENHFIYQRGNQVVRDIRNGVIEKLMTISLLAPELKVAKKLTLYARLSGGAYEVSNQWDYWVFPRVTLSCTEIEVEPSLKEKYGAVFEGIQTIEASTKVLSALTAQDIDFIEKSGKVLLLGCDPFSTLPTSFQPSVSGRTQGNVATVIEDHPLMNRFPHDGFCDWQFHGMLEGGNTVLFNDLGMAFDPIVEIVSSYKLIRRQASLFELRLGQGKLLVCTLNINQEDPAAVYLLNTMMNYVNSDMFQPRNVVEPRLLKNLITLDTEVAYDFSTDEALDPNVNRRLNA